MGIATDYHDMLAAVLLRQFHEQRVVISPHGSWAVRLDVPAHGYVPLVDPLL